MCMCQFPRTKNKESCADLVSDLVAILIVGTCSGLSNRKLSQGGIINDVRFKFFKKLGGRWLLGLVQ